MWRNRRGSRSAQIYVHREYRKRQIWISGKVSVHSSFIRLITAHNWTDLLISSSKNRSKAWKNAKASVQYHDERANQFVRWACANQKRWKCWWVKYGHKRNYCAKRRICVIPYWRVPYNLAWQLGMYNNKLILL